MQKRVSRLFSMLLAAVMVLSIAMTGLAAEIEPYSSSTDTSFTITVSYANSGETYTAYKVFDVTYNDNTATEEDADNRSYSYTIEADSAWYNTVSNSGLFTLTQINGSDTYIVTVNDGVTGEQIATTLSPVPEGAVAAASVTAEEVIDTQTGASGTTTVTLDVTSSGPGYYYVTTSLGSVVSIDTINPNAEITEKNAVPGITKEVENESHDGTFEEGSEGEGTQDTAKVGDILEYKIEITNAAHKSALTLHDEMTAGLTYYGSEHINVYLNSVSASAKVSSDWYTIQDSECEDGCDFEIVFSPEWLDDLDDDDVIIVTYEAVVNEAAVKVNGNDAYLTYGTDGYTVMVETETDVYGLNLEKVDGDGNELDGAIFTLAYSNGTLIEFYYDEESNIYIVHDAIDEEYADEVTTTEILVGSATIFGLDAGTYTLTETEAPEGYNKLASVITVTIADDGTVSISGDTQGSLTDGTITVVNNSGAILPSTGGMGTTIFYIVGIVLMICAAAFFIARKRINKEE